VDIANVNGTPIKAPVGGTVVNAVNNRKQGDNNFGNTLELKDNNGNVHQFHHLQNVNFAPGQIVSKGQPIASMGNTGATYSASGKGDGTNLDYRIVNAAKKYLDPTKFIKFL